MPQTAGGTEVPMTEGETQQGGAPNYSLIVKGFIGLVVVLAIGFFLANSFSGNDAGESDQKKPEKIPENKINPVSERIAGSGIVVGGEVLEDETDINDATIENKKKEIKVYNKELYMTDISLSDSVAEFYVENRDNSYKSAWFSMQISYSFETPDGELKQGATTSIPINQEKVDIAPGAKVKFTVDVRETLSSRMGYVGMENFQILQLESS